MKIIYENKKIEKICTDLKEAIKYFGGDKSIAKALIIRINYLNQFPLLSDLIKSNFGFHNLKNKLGRDLKGYFSIYVKTKVQAWRIILEPLNENEKPYIPCNIDKIAKEVKTIKILEVSKHYE